MPSDPVLIAVDVGNSRLKLGRFERAVGGAGFLHGEGEQDTLTPGPSPTERGEQQDTLTPALSPREREKELPRPNAILELPLLSPMGDFDVARLAEWCALHVGGRATWLVASVHRGAAERLEAAVATLTAAAQADWQVRRLTWRDVPMRVDVDEPDRVGMDRLLTALVVDQIRPPERAAIVVDVGSAITVDLVTPDGTFAGGAILPGLALSARTLDEHTDALPLVPVDEIKRPAAVGKSTVAAIESGLFWGAVGAVRELIVRLSADQSDPPEVIVTGGASRLIAAALVDGTGRPLHHLPHLVLAGIALVGQAGQSGGHP